MAHHAWLDSLSEDWVSQPRSDSSQMQQPNSSSPPSPSDTKNVRDRASRIPRPHTGTPGVKRPQHLPYLGSPGALNERSPNNVNIKITQVGSSKLSHETKPAARGRRLSRSVSAATTSSSGSVIHNSVLHHKSQSASPSKGRGSEPEWRRRLVHGELNYGESKDLFSSAGTGLENIFRPPPTSDAHNQTMNETTLPSSPPPYRGGSRQTAEYDEGLEDDIEDDLEGDSDSSVQHNITLLRPISFRSVANGDAGNTTKGEGATAYESPAQVQPLHDNTTEASSLPIRGKEARDEDRKASGQSVIQNEDFSPIFIARHSSEGGGVSFAPIAIPASQLRNKLENLQRDQLVRSIEPQTEKGTETPDDGAGNFANVQRGDQTIDGSFCHRPLSPSMNMDSSDMLPESSLQASTPKQLPTVRVERIASAADSQAPVSPPSPDLPRAPFPSPEKRSQPVLSSKSGSSLKLFGPYDTFTNQTLLRRISQFEDQPSNNSLSYSDEETAPSPTPLHSSRALLSARASKASTAQKSAQSRRGQNESFGAVNRFGAGQLDDYEFDGDISLSSSAAPYEEEKENVTPEPSRVTLGSPWKFTIHEDVLSEGDSLFMRWNRHRGKRPTSSARYTVASKDLKDSHANTQPNLSELNDFFPSLPRRGGSEAKRPRTSPSKDPTPKRRRTLHRSDIAFGLEDRRTTIATVQSSHHTMQSAITRDRAKSLNMGRLDRHQDLRPGSPTPSPRESQSRVRAPLAELGFIAPPDSAATREPGPITEDPSALGSRKASMKTQDFYEAAEEIMAMIRNKARPVTGLASVEESEAESSEQPGQDNSGANDDSVQDSTQEPFSRPPSREGPALTRLPRRQEDPELIDRLKKYEEHSDNDDILAPSFRSLRPVKDAQESLNGRAGPIEGIPAPSNARNISQQQGEIISDLPYVRISRNPDINLGGSKREYLAHESPSSVASTFPSVRTGSSRGSDSRRLIGPNVVAQLIGNQVGNMVFDEENKIWQKVKTPKPIRITLPSEDSEEDPFAGIPDLTVDIIEEENHLNMGAGHSHTSQQTPRDNSPTNATSFRLEETAEGSVKLEQSMLAHRQDQVETAVEDDEEIEHEISLHEDRIQKATPNRKNLTITFSSPIASVVQDFARREADDSSFDADSSREHSLASIAADSMRRGRHCKIGRSVSGMTGKSSSRSRSRGIPTNASAERQGFVPRPVSRIDEQDENLPDSQQSRPEEQGQLSILAESAMAGPGSDSTSIPNLSVALATPDRLRVGEMFATPMIGQYVGTLSLSPMSEFTVHQIDQSCALEVSYVVGEQYLVTGDGTKKVMSKAVRCLVEKITEVEPFEPDWDSMPELDLSNKQLDSLHMLDEFCTAVVTLDASNNSVSHLDGVPQSVRNLRMTHNLLSELTAWRQLMNLQYVDVSHNQLTSLSAFKDLVHLRTLRADNNQITTLDGIKFHDALQVLRLRSNLLTHVDFEGTKLQHLAELDLEDNKIVSFDNIEQLSSLHTVNLQRNCLKAFGPSKGQAWPSVRYLKLSSNDLESLDLTAFPSLRLLHADRNNITTITGFSKCHRLDSLSLREQKGHGILDTSFLNSAFEVRKLFLSGNRLSGFSPRVDFLNLQYLELANCGLRCLEPNIGQLMPNLRFLNINFNAIDDLLPLRYIPRLKKLLAAGNRLSEAGKVANALAEFPHLSRLDLRNNGATLGFHAPVQTLLSAETGTTDSKEFDPFVLPDIDVELQNKFASRLDMDTRMRKRIYDMVILRHCRRIQVLDGLPVDRGVVTCKDDVWEALVQSGILERQTGQEANASLQ
ncbi:hypothetical protein F5Y17DRAFT_416234 [Xylariaceae sp. FL0594]|nr:hypothetical protein F5Y17DRAFT_416234 [Xylariaceae sp. FL0594]